MSNQFVRLIFIGLCWLSVCAMAQTKTTTSLSEVVEIALQNYPAIRAVHATAQSAKANIELARTALQPKVDFIWQQNFASRNNVFGLLLPQSTIPGISGPALGTSGFASVFGSATGILVSWEPYDFGLREANINLARSINHQAAAQIAVTKLDVTTTAADAYLAVIASDQAVIAARANVVRMETFAQAVHVLVDNQLRPGADASRIDAELAVARNQFIQAEQTAALARTTLAEAIGQAGTVVNIDPNPFQKLPPNQIPPATDFTQHPFALAQQSAFDVVKARQTILEKSYYPKLNWQSALFARGSGAFTDGRLKYTRGFYPDTANWATGISLSFSPTEIFGLRAKKKIENFNSTVEQAHYDQTIQKLKAQDSRAKVYLDSARKLAANTPLQVKAAQETELRIRARYQAELATITEVAEAQKLLAQAEVENSLAKLSVWRALLMQAKANGEMKSFLELLK